MSRDPNPWTAALEQRVAELERENAKLRKAAKEATRTPGVKPDPVGDPIMWRKWWLALHAGKTWADAGVAWRAAVG